MNRPSGPEAGRDRLAVDAYDRGWDDGRAAMEQQIVCSVCGADHDADESAACEGCEAITLKEWTARVGIDRDRFRSAYKSALRDLDRLDENAREFYDRMNTAKAERDEAIKDAETWASKLWAAEADRDRLAEAIQACIADAEGQEALAPDSRKTLTLTNGQARLLADALASLTRSASDDPH